MVSAPLVLLTFCLGLPTALIFLGHYANRQGITPFWDAIAMGLVRYVTVSSKQLVQIQDAGRGCANPRTMVLTQPLLAAIA